MERRIVYFIDTLGRGGAETLLLSICKNLKKRYPQFAISVITHHTGDDLVKDFETLGISVECLHLDRCSLAQRFYKIYKALKKYKPDVLHTHLLYSDRYGHMPALLAGIAVRICTVHNMEQDRSYQDAITRKLTSLFSTTIVAVSQSVRDFSIKNRLYSAQKMTTICNASNIDATLFTPRTYSMVKQVIKLVNIGRLTRQKSQETLLRCMDNLNRSRSGAYELHLYGIGEDLPNLQGLIRHLGLQNVFLYGLVDNAQISSILRSCDIFISSSLWEGFHLSVVEAMSCGLPVVLSDIPPHRELFQEVTAEYPYFAKPHDHETFKEMVLLLAQAENYNQAARIAHRQSFKYSLDTMVDSYAALYMQRHVYKIKKGFFA
jgi:glycosyltransferase involved in cell wall biosynthesis